MTTVSEPNAPSGQQLERLAHIEFLAYFMGKVSRKCIMSRFDVSQAAATRDLRLYNDKAPDNIVYDPRQKHYIPTDTFKCHFPLSVEKCLNTLSSGFGDYLETMDELKVAHTLKLSQPDLKTTAMLVRAIALKKPIHIEYFSVSSGKSKRTIIPFAVLDSGLRWHVRAYDREKSRFSDFVINRIISAKILKNEKPLSHEKPENDSQWEEYVNLIIQAHPKKSDMKDVIENEYGMKNGCIIKRIKKCYVGYLLRSWDIDCTLDASLKGPHIFLHLKNAQEISDLEVDSFMLAPGNEGM